MKKMTYDQALSRLEEIVKQLENEATPIEDSLKLFKEGIELTKFCNEKLAVIEKEMKVVSDTAGETASDTASDTAIEGDNDD